MKDHMEKVMKPLSFRLETAGERIAEWADDRPKTTTVAVGLLLVLAAVGVVALFS